MNTTQRIGTILVRVVVALVFVIHGLARVRLGLVDEFGVLLGQFGVPTPTVTAWVITAAEVLGGLTLAAGLGVVWLCGWFALELAVGIALVHASHGWFVVGPGRGGMEYSVVLMTSLAAVALMHGPGQVRATLRLIRPRR
ncbi:DoxX family protein [Haliangium sp.]|uniref:DoxX family protein n=1 Tax=Haliangium sp. TaxID=2663208 RepID=UPI003D0EAD18